MATQIVPKSEVEYEFREGISNPGPKTPIVLVHGAYNNAYMWEENFMTYFSQRGHPVYAIHLKRKRMLTSCRVLFAYRLTDYVARLSKLVDMIDTNPILIGHSMGGLVIQRYLSIHPERAKGACLLAALPPFGMKNTLKSMVLNPIRFIKYILLTLAPAIARSGKPPGGLLSDRGGETTRKHFQSLIVRESARALIGCLSPRVNLENVKRTPLLILGAEYDNLALPKDVIKTGELYGQEAYIFPEMGHFMMMEPEWETVAGRVNSLL